MNSNSEEVVIIEGGPARSTLGCYLSMAGIKNTIYENKLRAGTEIWYEFIRFYYKLLPALTHFIRSKQHRIEVLRLLQGEVFDRREVPVLDAMRKFIHAAETTRGHAFAGALSDIRID